ncbi:MAG: hypothetical protein I8H74_02250 [Moraxellaceae bacterium]|nr:hypothetical protein [Moraxellaceae bacterium]
MEFFKHIGFIFFGLFLTIFSGVLIILLYASVINSYERSYINIWNKLNISENKVISMQVKEILSEGKNKNRYYFIRVFDDANMVYISSQKINNTRSNIKNKYANMDIIKIKDVNMVYSFRENKRVYHLISAKVVDPKTKIDGEILYSGDSNPNSSINRKKSKTSFYFWSYVLMIGSSLFSWGMFRFAQDQVANRTRSEQLMCYIMGIGFLLLFVMVGLLFTSTLLKVE